VQCQLPSEQQTAQFTHEWEATVKSWNLDNFSVVSCRIS